VVAQVLDYARAIARWSYSDLQRQVSAATGKQGNVPFEVVQGAVPEAIENHFIDSVTQTMRSGRFLLLIAGDGIREDVGALAELINRNAALGFSFGLVEIALYDLGGSEDGGLAIQPRVVAKSQLIERGVVVLRNGATDEYLGPVDDEDDGALREGQRAAGMENGADRRAGESPRHAEYRRWWQPVLDMTFDDPDQEPPKLFFPNNVRAQLPWPGTWVTAYNSTITCGVFLAGREGPLLEAWERLAPDLDMIAAELPNGTKAGTVRSSGDIGILTDRKIGEFANDDAKRDWLRNTLNAYVNALRPRLRRAIERA
jgi:hypothetical protein